MINLKTIAPGDVIHRCYCSIMDQDVPLMVIACKFREGNIVNTLHVLGLYMVASGCIILQEIDIDSIGAHDYKRVM